MKLKMILGSVLFIFSVIALAQHSGSDDSDGADDFDLNALISRVSQSRALGFLTKLSLKRDVDRLLENVRKYHKVDHEQFVRKQLFSIVNLAGHECAGVLSYERLGPRDNIVICEGQTMYRIRVTPEGRVAVEKQPIDK